MASRTDLHGPSLRVLIVDDDPGVCKLLKELAERWDYTPLVTGRASDAFDTVRRGYADIMLLDI